MSHPDVHFVFPINKSDAVCDDFLPEFRKKVLDDAYISLEDWQNHLKDEKKPVIYTKEGNEIIRKLSLKSFEANYKIMIIWCAETMHESCANRVLKVVEEPQGQTLFIFISDKPENLLATIRSRTQLMTFPPIDNDSLLNELNNRNLYDENADFYIKNSKGSWRELMNLIFTNETQHLYFELFVRMMRNCWKIDDKTLPELQVILKEITDLSRSSQIAFLQNCQREIRENFIYRLKNSNLNYMNNTESDFAQNFSKIINERNIEIFMSELSLAESHINQNINSKFVFFDLMLKINNLFKL
jgi:DNA polymerase-3 subunit delta'